MTDESKDIPLCDLWYLRGDSEAIRGPDLESVTLEDGVHSV